LRAFLAGAAVLVIAAVAVMAIAFSDGSQEPSGPAPAEEELEEETEEQEERTRGREEELERARDEGTLGLIEPLATDPAPGWAGQELWQRKTDDWEPAVAGRPGSSRVFTLTTRYGGKRACGDCPSPAIRLRASEDGGDTWGPTEFLCPCQGSRNQYDPEIEMAADGSLYAAWLDGFTPGVTFARSDDNGETWTEPIAVDGPLAWSDKEIVAVSDDGEDVYIIFNGPSAGDAHVAVSHDRGETFAEPVGPGPSERYHFAGGGVVTPDGTVAFAQTSYNQESNGAVRVLATVSSDDGQSWENVPVDRMGKQPDCVSTGCPADYYGPQAAMAADSAGRLVIVYNGANRRNGKQGVFARSSTDGGLSWSARTRLSPRGAIAAFPAAVGGDDGDFRIWYMDDRRGAHDRWNVWFRSSEDAGESWSPSVRISDATAGTAYIKGNGFLEPYGDYGELAIVGDGATFAAWGEGMSYFGPGGTWFNRTE
jgi:BNR repeat-like domain